MPEGSSRSASDAYAKRRCRVQRAAAQISPAWIAAQIGQSEACTRAVLEGTRPSETVLSLVESLLIRIAVAQVSPPAAPYSRHED